MSKLTWGACVLPIFLSAQPAVAVTAHTADEVCPASADPCVITEPVRVDRFATFDFGVRDVELSGAGQLDFGVHGGSIRCGDFEAVGGGTPIVARGREGSKVNGSPVTIRAQRACSIGSPAHPCVEDDGCDLDSCSVHVCTGSLSRTCGSDADCQVGICSLALGRCSGSFAVRCSSNADCNLGTCPAELSCSRLIHGKRGCTTDTDCQLGACSEGTGSIALAGTVEARGAEPGRLTLVAADTVDIDADVNLATRARTGDGGSLGIHTTFGDVNLSGRLRSRGGISGGRHEIDAGGNVHVDARINMDGGDFDGGSLEIDSGGDVVIQGSISANARNGSGFGGEVLVSSDGDIEIGPGPDSGRLLISTNGHGNGLDSGDGGYSDFLSYWGSVIVHEGVRIVSNAAAPYGVAGDVYFDAYEHVQFDGEYVAGAHGIDSRGGSAFFYSNGTVELGPASEVDVDCTGGGGVVEIDADGDVLMAGDAHGLSPDNSDDGLMRIVSGGDVFITGRLAVGGDQYTDIDIRACRIDVLDGARLENTAQGGHNLLLSRESMRLHDGSELLAVDGINRLVYRAAEKPPLVGGLVDAPAVLELRPVLTGCPVCGNSEIDQSETCDDGNVVDGDGCSSTCMVE
jgi:cysteine-rich repeat protein